MHGGISVMVRHLSPMIFGLVIVILVVGPAGSLVADLIPPGHKSVSHKLVFVDSQLLQSHRVIAMPVRGFGGAEEVKAGHPFRFSSKYGTRLYAVPRDFVPPKRVSPGKPLPFPSCEVPVTCVTSVPGFSPVASLTSTCKLSKVTADQIRVELIEHVELDAQGRPASMRRSMLPLLVIASVGLLGCLLLWRRARTWRNGDSYSAGGLETSSDPLRCEDDRGVDEAR